MFKLLERTLFKSLYSPLLSCTFKSGEKDKKGGASMYKIIIVNMHTDKNVFYAEPAKDIFLQIKQQMSFVFNTNPLQIQLI